MYFSRNSALVDIGGTPYIPAQRTQRRRERPCAISRKRVRPCTTCTCVYVVERSGGCSPACLPRLSGALPDRTLNSARLNLGIIRGYKPSLCSSLLLRSSPTTARSHPSSLIPCPVMTRDISFAARDGVRERGTTPARLPPVAFVRANILYTGAVVPTCKPLLRGSRTWTELLSRTHRANLFRR